MDTNSFYNSFYTLKINFVFFVEFNKNILPSVKVSTLQLAGITHYGQKYAETYESMLKRVLPGRDSHLRSPHEASMRGSSEESIFPFNAVFFVSVTRDINIFVLMWNHN